jgi:serine/threonine protein kinase
MRVMFKIVEEDPPTFRDKSKWSDPFVSFVTTCLVKDPALRPSIQNLLSHPFLSGISDEEMAAVFKIFIHMYVMQQEARRQQTDTTLAGRKKIQQQPPKAINVFNRSSTSTNLPTASSMISPLSSPSPTASAAASSASAGLAKKKFGWHAKKSPTAPLSESSSSKSSTAISGKDNSPEKDLAVLRSTEIRLKLSDSLKNMEKLENLLKVSVVLSLAFFYSFACTFFSPN